MSEIITPIQKMTIVKGTSVGCTTYIAELHPEHYMNMDTGRKYYKSVPSELLRKWEKRISKLLNEASP